MMNEKVGHFFIHHFSFFIYHLKRKTYFPE